MLNVRIKTIPKEEHRECANLGDYYYERNQLTVVVSEMGNPRYEMLAAIHELVEAFLAEHEGVSFGAIDQFDKNFNGDGEPGDDKNAPYYWQHQLASVVEQLLTQHLKTNWHEYNDAVDKYSNQEDDEQT